MTTSFKRTTSTVVGAAGLALCALSNSASADELSWSATATGTSDYIFRGLSLNNEDPAFQASIDAEYGIWYAGLWGSMVDDGAAYEPVELNLYAGVKPVVGPVTFDFGVIYYFYPWAEDSDGDIFELKAAFDWSPVDKLTLSPAVYWIPDQSNADSITTYEGTAAYELPAVGVFSPSVSGTVGWTEADVEYTYWNAGLALAVEKFTFDFRYWDTDINDDPASAYVGLSDERFVFTASITLP